MKKVSPYIKPRPTVSTLSQIFLFILFVWYTLDITGFALGDFVLVESPGFFSIDFAWWIIFALGSALYFSSGPQGNTSDSVFQPLVLYDVWCDGA